MANTPNPGRPRVAAAEPALELDIARVEMLMEGNRMEIARNREYMPGLALVRDGIDRIRDQRLLDLGGGGAADGDALAGILEGLHILITTRGREYSARTSFLEEQNAALEQAIRAARSGLVVPR